jgi:hypothetical protein
MKISHVLKLCSDFENRLTEIRVDAYTSRPSTSKTNVKASDLEDLIFISNESFGMWPITQ